MADVTLNYNPGTYTLTLPLLAINITIQLAGAQGGNGGGDGGIPGGTRGPGRKGEFSLPNNIERTLTLYVASQGGNGWGCVSNSGNGGGGAGGVASGGGGGRTGPQGCSGGGGGGGGATGIYDNYSGTYIIVAGGGGGAGGGSYPDSWLRGGNGGAAGNFTTSTRSITNGGTGRSQGYDGGGGGGGGGGASGGGGGREGADDRAGRYPSGGGGGGGSYYRSAYTTYTGGSGSNYGNGYVTINYDLADPEFTSFTVSDPDIIRGETVTFSWTTSFTQFITLIRLRNPDGTEYTVTGSTSITLQPQISGNWTITLYYNGGSDTISLGHIVYIPPTINLSLDENPIPIGASTVLRWTVDGDASTMNIEPGIGNTNINSFSPVNPSVTTTYTAYADGPGGSDSEEITLVVWQRPVVQISGPPNVYYGNNVNIIHSQTESSVSYELSIEMTDLDGVVTTDVVDLGAAESTPDTTYTHVVPWHSRGPSYIRYTLVGTGEGELTDTESINVPAVIDQLPDPIDIPETDDTIRNEEPVVTPDVEVTTQQLVIDDIDIPVEIKADYPIQVEIDNDAVWRDVRQL